VPRVERGLAATDLPARELDVVPRAAEERVGVGDGIREREVAQTRREELYGGHVRTLRCRGDPLPRPEEELTPLEELRPGVWLKREDTHELGAFKWRGALPALRAYGDVGTVVTASTGNHGAATAWAAAQLGLRAVVYVPELASATKLDHMERLGADVRREGADMDEAKEYGRAEAAGLGVPFFEDGAEPAQYDGYAAIGDEILDQLDEPPAAVVVPVGNGALLGGIGRAVLARAPATLRIGVVAAAAPVMADSWDARRPVESSESGTFADGLAVRVAIPYAVEVLNEVATHMLRVTEAEIAEGVLAYQDAGIRAEGAAGAGLSALPKLPHLDGAVVLVVTGRNIDDDLLARLRSLHVD